MSTFPSQIVLHARDPSCLLLEQACFCIPLQLSRVQFLPQFLQFKLKRCAFRAQSFKLMLVFSFKGFVCFRSQRARGMRLILIGRRDILVLLQVEDVGRR